MKLTLIQIPWDSGDYNKRVGQGPLHLVNQGLIEYLEHKDHHIKLVELKLSENFITDTGAAKDLNSRLSETVKKARKNNRFPLILAGNCNTALGAVAGLGLNKPGIMWFDAHADFNTPDTSSSGFFDGMALSVLTGNSWKQWRKTISGFSAVDEQNVILIGARDFDSEEKNLLDASAMSLIAVSDIRNDLDTALTKSFKALSKRSREVYLHVDLDVFDPAQLKANRYFSKNGLMLNEVKKIIHTIGAYFKIGALSFTAYNPNYDTDNEGYKIVKSILETTIPILCK